VSGLLFLSFQNIFGMIFFWLARIRAIVHDGSSAIGSRIRDRTPRDFSFGPDPRRPIAVEGRVAPLWVVTRGDAERVAHPWSRTAMERRREPDEVLPARPKARRRKSSRTALCECGAGNGEEIFLPANP
jgi:hypothetical protein